MNKGRYTFVINYERVNNGRTTNYEHIINRASINNEWFLMADYVIDTKTNSVIKSRRKTLTDAQILSTYNS